MQMNELQDRIYNSPLNDKIQNMRQLHDLQTKYPTQKQFNYTGNPEDRETDNVSIYELEDDNLIERVRHLLSGEVYDPEEKEWIKHPDVRPPMNNRGVHQFMIQFGGHLDKNIKLSFFDLKRIHEMMIDICNAILKMFWYKREEFQIELANMNMIMNLLEHNIYANYMRALNGGERKHRETLIKLHETSIEKMGDQSKGGSFLSLNPFTSMKKKQEQPMQGGENYGY